MDFTGTSAVKYKRGRGETISLAPPPEGFLFCPVPTTLSKASLDCLANGIHFPKGALMWALSIELGKPLGDDWLLKNQPFSTWTGEPSSSELVLTLSIHRYS